MIARQSASKRATLSVMLSSTMNRARAPDVLEHAREVVSVEVAAAHSDDRAEAAVEGAAPGGLDHVDRLAQQRVTSQHARAALGQAQLAAIEVIHGSIRIVNEPVAAPVA